MPSSNERGPYHLDRSLNHQRGWIFIHNIRNHHTLHLDLYMYQIRIVMLGILSHYPDFSPDACEMIQWPTSTHILP